MTTETAQSGSSLSLWPFRLPPRRLRWRRHLASLLTLDDLVAAGDAFVYHPRYADRSKPAPQPYTSLERLAHSVRLYRGRGKKKLLEAHTLLREGCASATETR